MRAVHGAGQRAEEDSAIAQAVQAGVALHQRGLLDDAERLYAGILKLAPDHFDALHLLGVVRQQRGDSAEAVRLIEAALKIKADSAEALTNYGQVLLHLHRYPDAVASLDRAIALAPDQINARINRATALIELERYAEALADAEHVLRLDDRNVAAFTKRGDAFSALGRHEEAVASYDCALTIDPVNQVVLNNRGFSLRELGRLEAALANFDVVLAIRPDFVEALINRGHILVELHREKEALESYQTALAHAPEHYDGLFNLGVNRLRLGDFARGWTDYEWRWRAKEFARTERKYPHPRWRGEKVQGTLLVSGEQGLGDQILFASMLPDVVAFADKVIVEVEPRLIPLFARSFPDIDFAARERALYAGPADAQLPMGSLGKYLRTSAQAFPFREFGFLLADARRAAALRERLSDGRRVIGLSWRSRNPKYESAKSTALRDFEPLLRLPDCRFVDLQYGDTLAEREEIARDLGVRIEKLDDIDNTNDLDGLAALIAACGLVVTVSNTTAHLAGALGQDTVVLVPSGFGRMWCWMTEREDSLFYPGVRLKRQRPLQPWADLLRVVAGEISALSR